jgi:LPXTG-motif cell wall-anchored protein
MESASAQIVPAINLECQSVHPSGNLELYVSNNSSGNVSDYAECTVSNPNLYQEKIRILVFSNGLNQESPADFYVEANSEVDFQVKIWTSEGGWENQTREITIIAEVLEANGVPPPLYTYSESELLVDIIVYEEAQETEIVISEKSDDDKSLIYAGAGGAILLLLILFIFVKRRK